MERILKLVCLSIFCVGLALGDVTDICLICYFTYFVLPILICVGLISLPVIGVCVYFRLFYKKSPWKENSLCEEKTTPSVVIEERPPAYDGNTVNQDCNV
eukprot:TRINITY_DN1108_c0_g2_i1.p2 TRINITY_DN1108_c0_g2~~TRINITY_DN1108_c0_g2_i1.p2  ORF type:complete len:100 (+),score=24.58 TRINITY_DN1108_c0_g2_i1:341-640(+)